MDAPYQSTCAPQRSPKLELSTTTLLKDMKLTNSKLQAALDELERLRDTVNGYKERNGKLPNPDSDAGRALFTLQTFTLNSTN